MQTLLENELKTYELHKDELIATSREKFVLIKDDKVCGVFDTEGDAIRQGYKKFGNVPFLVKQVVEVETPIYINLCSCCSINAFY